MDVEQAVSKTEMGLSQPHKSNKGFANDFNRMTILSELSLPFLKEYENGIWQNIFSGCVFPTLHGRIQSLEKINATVVF